MTTVTNLDMSLFGKTPQTELVFANDTNTTTILTEVAEAITALDSDVADTTTQITNLTTEVTNISSDVTYLTTEVTNLTTEITNVNVEITNLTTEVTNLTTNVTNLTTDVTNLTTEITNLNTDVTYLLTNAVLDVQVTSTYDALACPGITPVDLFDAPSVPAPNTVSLNLRPLISSDGSILINHSSGCGFVDIRSVSGGGGGVPMWESVLDSTGTDVVRPYLANPSLSGGESLVFGIQNMNTNGANQLFYDRPSGAFRVGTYSGTEWYKVNLGAHSFASGINSQASGTRSFIAGGQNNSVNAQDTCIAGGSGNSALSGATGFIAGAANCIMAQLNSSAVIGGDTISGELSRSFITGTNAVCGINASSGIPGGLIVGSFGAFDASQDAPHFLETDFTCKMMYRNGFIRGSGSKSYDGLLSSIMGNDGAREVFYPSRHYITSGNTANYLIPVSPDHMLIIHGTMMISVAGDLSRRACFLFNDGIFTRVGASPSVAIDNQPTVYKQLSVPLALFDIADYTFSSAGTNISINMTAPLSADIIVNLVVYVHDLA